MFQHILTAWRIDSRCSRMLKHANLIVTSLFNLVISSFPDNMFYHAWTWLLIYHNRSNNVVQVCSFIEPWAVYSNMHKKACQQYCSSHPAQICSSLSTGKNKLCVFTCVVQCTPTKNNIIYLFYTIKTQIVY